MIVSEKKYSCAYVNDITRYLDRYLIRCNDCLDLYSNYIFNEPVNGNWAIRVPGATRGHIKIEDGVVTEIKLYEDSFCYKKDVFDDLKKFIGMKIDLGK